ncbi:MAG: ATP synthase subunit I [Deltaproteobacteria bacterium]
MTTQTTTPAKISVLGRVEKAGLIVTVIIAVANLLIGSRELAYGAAVGGLMVVANFLAIKFIVASIIGNAYSKGFSIFVLLIKLLVLVGAVVFLFLFTKVNIYGFFIGVTGVVLVIIGESLKGSSNGTL